MCLFTDCSNTKYIRFFIANPMKNRSIKDKELKKLSAHKPKLNETDEAYAKVMATTVKITGCPSINAGLMLEANLTFAKFLKPFFECNLRRDELSYKFNFILANFCFEKNPSGREMVELLLVTRDDIFTLLTTGIVQSTESQQDEWLPTFMIRFNEWLFANPDLGAMDKFISVFAIHRITFSAHACEIVAKDLSVIRMYIRTLFDGASVNTLKYVCRSVARLSPKAPKSSPFFTQTMRSLLHEYPHPSISNVLTNWVCRNRILCLVLVKEFDILRQVGSAISIHANLHFIATDDVNAAYSETTYIAGLRLARNLCRKQPSIHKDLVPLVYRIRTILHQHIFDPDVLIPSFGILVNLCSSRIGRTAVLMCGLDSFAMFIVEKWVLVRGPGKSASMEICRLTVALLWGTSILHSRNDPRYVCVWMTAVIRVAKEFPKNVRIVRTCLGAIRTRSSIHRGECKATESSMLTEVRDFLKGAEKNFSLNQGILCDVEMVRQLLFM